MEQKSYFMWEGVMADVDKMRFTIKKFRENGNPYLYSAFTTSELGEVLPEGTVSIKTVQHKFLCCNYKLINDIEATSRFYAKTEADARAKMLVYLLENKLI